MAIIFGVLLKFFLTHSLSLTLGERENSECVLDYEVRNSSSSSSVRK